MKSPRLLNVAVNCGPKGKEKELFSKIFRFVEYSQAKYEVKGVNVAKNTMLEGHVSRLQVSKRSNKYEARVVRKKKRSNSKAKPGTILLVLSITFEAARTKAQQLFSFGHLKWRECSERWLALIMALQLLSSHPKNEAVATFEALSSFP